MKSPQAQPGEPPEWFSYPGAQAPERTRWVDAWGVGICVVEWGEADAPPLLLGHGAFDFARTFDVFAPLLAAGGWRVVAWDHRGHGDSEHSPLYSWEADVRDAVAVLDATTREPLPVVGHSKGAGLLTELCLLFGERISRFVNIDGLPSQRRRQRDFPEDDRVDFRAREFEDWLESRRRAATVQRRPGTIDELAQRRGRMNPRLPIAWLRYLVTVGARRDADGWRWKIDPALRMLRLGPWRSDWALERLASLTVPMLAMLGGQQEPMGWGTAPEGVIPHLPPEARLEVLKDTGHFIHIEQPERVADMVLEFLS